MVRYIQIVAVSDNGVIADDDGIPWSIQADYQHYKSTVKDSIVISGRKTFESIPSHEGREHIVLTRTEDYEQENVHVARSISEAREIASELVEDDEPVYIIGGERVYESFLPISDELIVSHIDGEYEGSVYYPEIDQSVWKVVSEDDGYDQFTIKVYERV